MSTSQENSELQDALSNPRQPINTRLYIADPSLTKVFAASAIAGVVGAVWLNAVVNLCTPWKGFK